MTPPAPPQSQAPQVPRGGKLVWAIRVIMWSAVVGALVWAYDTGRLGELAVWLRGQVRPEEAAPRPDDKARYLAAVNAERKKKDVGPLRQSAALSRWAAQRLRATVAGEKLRPIGLARGQHAGVPGYAVLGQGARFLEFTFPVVAEPEEAARWLMSFPKWESRLTSGDYCDLGLAAAEAAGSQHWLAVLAFRPAELAVGETSPEDADRLARAVNEARKKAGLPPLRREASLEAAARLELVYFARSGGKLPPERAYHTTGYSMGYVQTRGMVQGAGGDRTPQEMVRKFLEDPQRREIVLSPEYQDLGVASLVTRQTLARVLITAVRTPPRPPGMSDKELNDEVIRLTNAERARYGLKPVACNQLLECAALAHARDMAGRGFFSHQGSDGSMVKLRATRAGYLSPQLRRGGMVGENLAKGQPDPKSVVAGWMNSPEHRQNLLRPEFEEIGVALVTTPAGINYWVQVFGVAR